MKRCQKNRDIIFLYTIQFIVYINKFKFITIVVVSDLVCHGMVVPGKAVYINDSAKIAPDLQFKTILQLFNHKNNSTCTLCIAYNEIIFPQTYLYVQASIQNI